ncbi:MAG TPA: sialidase family protein [Polyangia bacterium]|nr:sialidase family protein [Polyangia bacterium]
MSRLVRIASTIVAVAAATALTSRLARANGAFPESFQLMAPADRPNQLILATNFGVILSDDAGATWTWTCERKDTTDQGYLYTVGPAPADRLFSVSPSAGLAYSNDESCTWARAGGTLDPIVASDVWPDPTDATKVYAIAAKNDGSEPPSIYMSTDGGLTFGAPIYTAPADGILQGIESARSDPMTIYGAMYRNEKTDASETVVVPEILRSVDGGATWMTIDVSASLGNNFFYIVAVDPKDATTLTARVIEAGVERLAISHDGGQTFEAAASLPNGTFTAYAHLASGTILAAGFVVADAKGFRSTDGGKTFVDWPVPHLRALAERDGKLWAAAKNFTDGWAIGVSTDEGVTFQPVAGYSDVKAIRACAQAVCETSCVRQAGTGVWNVAICDGADGGSSDGGAPPPAKSGCGCSASGAKPGAALGVFMLAAAALAARRRSRARRRS